MEHISAGADPFCVELAVPLDAGEAAWPGERLDAALSKALKVWASGKGPKPAHAFVAVAKTAEDESGRGDDEKDEDEDEDEDESASQALGGDPEPVWGNQRPPKPAGVPPPRRPPFAPAPPVAGPSRTARTPSPPAMAFEDATPRPTSKTRSGPGSKSDRRGSEDDLPPPRKGKDPQWALDDPEDAFAAQQEKKEKKKDKEKEKKKKSSASGFRDRIRKQRRH